MNDLMLSSLKAYWERLRAGRIAPYRAEIDPRQFESALENMFIIERISAENMRIRLAGMKVCEMMGMEVRGIQPTLFMAASDRAQFERFLNLVMTEPAVVELALQAENRGGPFHASMLLMPLRDDFGDLNRVLGCMSGESEIFAPPLAFRIRNVSVNKVEATQAGEPRRVLPGFAEEQAGFEPGPGAPRLRSIEGNPNAQPKRRAGPKLRVVDGK
jgi:hypothetical protein